MWLFTLLMCFIFLILGVSSGIIPLFSRSSAPFGVSLPKEFLRDTFIEKKKKRYAIWNIGISIVVSIPLLIMLFVESISSEWITGIYTIIGSFFIIIFSFLLYLKYRQEIFVWKKTLPQKSFQKSKKIVVDSDYHQKLETKGNFSVFMWQFVIIACTVILTYAFYNRIPQQIPIHWNIYLEVDEYMQKNFFSVLTLPAIQVALIPVFNFSHYSFVQSKQKLSPLKPIVSGEKSRLFRKAWSTFLWMTAILTQLLLSFLNLFSLFFKESPFWPMLVVIIIYLIVIIGATIYLTVNCGQAGEKLKLSSKDEEEMYYEDPEDERKWLGGILYYNPEDPSIFVEKRFGIGSTINMARWQSWMFIGGLAIFTIVIIFLSFLGE